MWGGGALLAVPILIGLAYGVSIAFCVGSAVVHSDEYGRILAFSRNGLSRIHVAREIDSHFEHCAHSISYGAQGTQWDTVAYFGGRYELHMQVPITVTSETQGTVSGPPMFQLKEIKHFDIPPDGVGGSISYRDGVVFGAVEWNKIHAAGGDFGAAGITIKQDPPLDGFDAFARVMTIRHQNRLAPMP